MNSKTQNPYGKTQNLKIRGFCNGIYERRKDPKVQNERASHRKTGTSKRSPHRNGLIRKIEKMLLFKKRGAFFYGKYGLKLVYPEIASEV